MKKLLFFLLLLIPFILSAAYITNVPMEVSQPDGSTITIYASGDEFHFRFHDKEGFTITRNNEGYLVYACIKNDNIEPTSYRVTTSNPRMIGLEKNLDISKKQWKRKRDNFIARTPQRTTRIAHTGEITNVVIFIRFQGESEFTTNFNVYDDILNNDTEGYNSLYNYYQEVSYQQLTVDAEFFPAPNNNAIVSYEDTHPRGYYEAYSTSNPLGYQGGDQGNERTQREHQLLANAAAYCENLIPEDLDIDSDGDGNVDNVIYIIKGSPNNWASLLWPHRWSLYSFEQYIHGKRVYDFNLQLESHLVQSGTSVMCHEFYHSLGAPDLYRYETDGNPVGPWDLMSNNTNPPQHMLMYMKYYYSEWLEEIPRITESGTYTLNPVSSNTDNVYKITSWNNREDIYLEYRRIDELFESLLQNEGLLVYKVDTYHEGEGNAGGPPDEVYVYRPGAGIHGGGNLSQAPLNNNISIPRTEFNFNSNPQAIGRNNLYTGVDIYNVQVTEENITFQVDISDVIITKPNAGDAVIANSNLDVEWKKKNTVAFVKLEYKDEIDGEWQLIADNVPATSDSYEWSVPELDSDNVYIKITDTASNTFDVINKPLTVVSGLTVPQLVQPTNNQTDTATEVTLKWNPVLGAQEYQVQYSLSNDFSDEFFTAENDSLVVSLSQHTTYYWRVRAKNGDLISTYSQIFSFTTGDYTTVPNVTQPITPANNSINQNFDSLTLEWTPIANAESYQLQICLNPYFYNDIPIDQDNITEANFSAENLEASTHYYWRVKSVNSVGTSIWSQIFSFTTKSETGNQDNNVPLVSGLLNNYPNPFNPQTTISFAVSENDKNTNVRIDIYNILGQKVKTLVNSNMNKGNHSVVWNGDDELNRAVASGIYFCKLKINSTKQVRKMLLMK